jgi:hypothetical protein
MSKPSLKEDIKDLIKVGGIVGALLPLIATVPITGLPAFGWWVVGEIQKQLETQLEPARHIGEVFLMTAPLTAALGLIGIGVLRGWFTKLWAFLMALGFTLVITAMIGNALGLLSTAEIKDLVGQIPKGPGIPEWTGFQLALGSMMAYEKLYGPRLFYASLAVGAFLGWAWGAKILARFNDRPVLMDHFAGYIVFLAVVPIVALLPIAAYFQPAPPPPELKKPWETSPSWFTNPPKLNPLAPKISPFVIPSLPEERAKSMLEPKTHPDLRRMQSIEEIMKSGTERFKGESIPPSVQGP